MNLRQIKFTDYYAEAHSKNQVYLHHTAGAAEGERTFSIWQSDPVKVATCVAISRDGEIVQGYSSKHWAYHLGLKNKFFAEFGLPYKGLDKSSIGIEICNWGFLRQEGGKFYTYVNKELPADRVIKLEKPFRGHEYWENYTDEQIESVRELLLLWHERYGIDLTYNEDIWAVTPRALKGENGVYTHCSVRPDKGDVYPHPGLIAMLKGLKK